ncbi:uncharacterized protein ACA1_008610 [Acanthamoeba castellanii str. Neff]|uniref:Uncharacterized protein n=1 Tax=Acanthamoeba castellanii (strain ATCC 30010 / Neff) TaxID=1257118 RepID=L8HFD3_ACACF|nr:uncharacterized protein ACA1_008610 [Acanthamoeba castellanii str. Neff]ELR23106.1 hypothetical protein ACA1_008610 [Acanthamoeba castellanii str. Neff]
MLYARGHLFTGDDRTWSGPNMAVAALIQRYLDQPDYALENREATFYEFERTVIRVHNVGHEEDYDYDGLDDDDDDNDYDHHVRTRGDEHTACLEQAPTNALASSQQNESREDEDVDVRHHAGLVRGIARYMRNVYGLHYGVRLRFGRRATDLARQGHRSCSNSPLRKYQGDDEPNEGAGAANDDNNGGDDGDCSFFHFAADVDLDGGLGPYAHALAFELAQARTDLMLGLFESFFSSSSSSSSVSASRASRSLSLSVRDGVEWTLSAQAGGPRHFAVRIDFADDKRRQLVSNMFGHDVPYYAPLFLDMRGAGSPVKLSCDGAGAMTLLWDVAMLEAHFRGPAARRRMWAQLAHCHRAVTLACCQAMREWHGRFRYM